MDKYVAQVWYRFVFSSVILLTVIAKICLVPSGVEAQSSIPARPELVLQFGHGSEIERLAFSRDGQVLASGDQAGVVKLWDMQSGGLIRTLQGPDDVVALALSPDGTTLAIGGYHGVDLWDWRQGSHLRFLSTQHSRVVGLAWSPDGKTLVSADGTAEVWDASSGQLLRKLKIAEYTGIDLATFSPDGKLLATSGSDGIRLWELATGKMLRVIAWEGALAVAFVPDGRTLVTSNGGDVRLWDVTTGRLLRLPSGIKQAFNGFVLTDDGATIVRGTRDKHIKLWDIKSGRLLRAIAGDEVMSGSRFPPRDVMLLSPDAKLLAQLPERLYSSIVVRDAMTGAVKFILAGSWRRLTSLSYAPDGKRLAAAQSAIQIWDITAGRLLRTLPAPGYGTNDLSFAPNGETLYGITGHGPDMASVTTWNMDTGRVKTWPPNGARELRGLTLSPDKKLLTGFDSHAAITVLDLQTGQARYQLKGFSAEVPSLAFSPDGTLLAAPSGAAINLWDIKTGHLHGTLKLAANHYGEFVDVAFSPDGSLLGARQHDSGDVLLWDVQSGSLLRALPGTGPTHAGFIFSPDSKTIAYGKAEHGTGIWDVQSGNLKLSLPVAGAMSFAPNGQTLALSDADGGSGLWDLKTGQLRATLLVLPDPPLTPGKASTIATTAPEWLIYTPEGFYDSSPGATKFMRWRLADHIFPAAQYATEYHRPDLVQQALQGNKHE